ncbi:MAG: NUDIX domain-containing protein [Kordiimonadaceae bacterium]|nr:NUDIX domain-containing protein [Kordiimonadaceae bacterium]
MVDPKDADSKKSDKKTIVPALPASSVLLVRDGDTGLEVLMMERAKTMKFAPGAFVFPGGKVDAEDSDADLWEGLTNSALKLSDFAFRLAALRELYEEAAVMLTVDAIEPPAGTQNFREDLLAVSGVLNTEGLVPFAHWVTPETVSRRFDTYFFLAAHNGQTAKHDGNEAISLRWVNPQILLADWEEDKVPLMFPTRLNLMKLARASSVAEALEQARNTPVVRTLPTITRGEDGISIAIDKASGYGVTEGSFRDLKTEMPK